MRETNELKKQIEQQHYLCFDPSKAGLVGLHWIKLCSCAAFSGEEFLEIWNVNSDSKGEALCQDSHKEGIEGLFSYKYKKEIYSVCNDPMQADW